MRDKLQKSNVQELFELSPVQKGMLFQYLKETEKNLYQAQLTFRIQGTIDHETLKAAFTNVQTRNEVLRSVFRWEKLGKPVQIILKECPFDFIYEDLSTLQDEDADGALDSLFQKESARRFDLQDLPVRLTLVKTGPSLYLFRITHHHILYDGWSGGILLSELFTEYNKLSRGIRADLESKPSYKEGHQAIAGKGDESSARAYWSEYLKGYEITPVPSGKVNGTSDSPVKKTRFQVTAANLESYANRKRITKAAVIYGALGLALHRLLNRSDVVFGITVSNRDSSIAGADRIIGNFINSIPLRVCVAGDTTLSDLVRAVSNDVISKTQYVNTSYSEIKEYLGLGFNQDLFDVVLAAQNYPLNEILAELNSEFKVTLESSYEATQYLLGMNVLFNDELALDFAHRDDEISHSRLTQITRFFKVAIDAILEKDTKTVGEIDFLDEAEKQSLLDEFDYSKVPFPEDKTVVAVFRDRVRETPDSVAVKFMDHKLTYRELDQASDRLARHLKRTEINRNEVIALLTDRSHNLTIGMLAVMKAGAAYMPIENDYPDERIEYMIRDSGARMVLASKEILKKNNFKIPVVFYEDVENPTSEEPRVEEINQPSDLCCIIYTSGTTGNPKGVMIEHRNIVGLFCNEQFPYDGRQGDVWTMFHSPCFDFSVWELYAALLSGGTVVIVPKKVAQDTAAFHDLLAREKVTMLGQTPSAFYSLIDQDSSSPVVLAVRFVMLGGEALSPKKLQPWKDKYPTARLYNGYGITETTIIITSKELGQADIDSNSGSIGLPLATKSVLILDENMKLVPRGSVGELYVGGPGVTRGYLNKKEITAQKFVPDPFNAKNILYKTGDLARIMESGDLEYHGRIDNQVQLRGFRIELGEVENQLLTHEQIKEAVAVCRETNESKILVAYYRSDAPLEKTEIQRFLAPRLLEHMLPSFYVHLSSFPLTSNGKVDKRALPDPELNEEADRSSPVSEVGRSLAEIWSNVLHIDKQAINNDISFFDVGGHSLKAVELVNRIFKTFNVQVPIDQLFENPTIAGLENLIQSSTASNGKAGDQYIPIQKSADQPYYPLSSFQNRLYFIHRFEPSSTAYNVYLALRIKGPLEKPRLKDAFFRLLQRHETLRTSFDLVDGIPAQRIVDEIFFDIETVDWKEGREEEAIRKFIRPFDLSKPPLMRVGLIAISDRDHILVVDGHHIVADAVSSGQYVHDLLSIYNNEPLRPANLQYKDYVVWQQNESVKGSLAKQKQFWLDTFTGEISTLDLPTDFPRPTVTKYEGDIVEVFIEPNEARKLKAVGESNQATLFMVLLSTCAILLNKICNQEKIIIGSPVAGRQHPDLEQIAGMFMNMIAIQSDVDGRLSFNEFVASVKAKTLTCFNHQTYPYEELIDALQLPRDISRNALFDVVFVLQNADEKAWTIPGLDIKDYGLKRLDAKFDLTFFASEEAGGIRICIQYATSLFKRETIARYADYYERIIKEVISDTSIKLSEIEILSETERKKLLYLFNDTETPFPGDKTLVELFEEQVDRAPESPALVWNGIVYPYSELNERANRLAWRLREYNLDPDAIVAILIDQSPGMVIGILGILKAGAAFLPIDTSYPIKRIQYMLEDSGYAMLISQADVMNRVGLNLTYIDPSDSQLAEQPASNVVINRSSRDLAYVIYTSGSTGLPKGSMIEHRSVVNLCYWHINHFNVRPSDRALKFASLGFDLTVDELFPYLIKGTPIYLVDEETKSDMAKLNRFCEQNQITIASLPTPVCEQFIQLENNSLRALLTGGDKLSATGINKYQLFNIYGPTEYTVFTTSFHVNGVYQNIPIGKPLSNTRLIITNADGKITPIGVKGELCISGVGLSRGYLNKEALTREKFVRNPYFPQELMYKTGDVARWLEDGNIEYLGRANDQVKIRGFRIELGEIEYHLNRHKQIRRAVVAVKDNDRNKFIVAYYISADDLGADKLKAYLTEVLPHYMVPEHFIRLEKMPLTPNGKINKKELPNPLDNLPSNYNNATNSVESLLVDIWSEVLKVDKEKIGIDQSFFELGGHSLNATTLANRIFKKTSIEVSVRAIFENQNIRSLTRHLAAKSLGIFSAIEVAKEREYYPLSAAQKRLYFLQQFDKGITAYNIYGALKIKGKLDRESLEYAFKEVVKRHSSLRTSFYIVNDVPAQKILPVADFSIHYWNRTGSDIDDLIQTFVRPFDLREAPLLRVAVVSLSAATETASPEYLLMVDMHHIISDGMSVNILINDLMALYAGKPLSPTALQYKDYTLWMETPEENKRAAKQKDFWLNEYSELPMPLELPYDYERPQVKAYDGDLVEFMLNRIETQQLMKISQSQNTSIYNILLSIFNVFLSKLANREEIVVGTPVAGRHHADLENIIGMFVNTLAIRNRVKSDLLFIELVSGVSAQTFTCLANAGFAYEDLIDSLNIPRTMNRNPLFDVFFALENYGQTKLEIPGLSITPGEYAHNVAKFDLSLYAAEQDNQLRMRFEYCTSLFSATTIDRFVGYFKGVVTAVAENPQVRISDIDILSDDEKRNVLVNFNDTYVPFPEDETIVSMFERTVQSGPAKMAITFGRKSFTYLELKECADRIAGYLRSSHHVSNGDLVGVLMERDADLIPCIYGILKTGAAYVPIDPRNPHERISTIVSDANLKLLLTKKTFLPYEDQLKSPVVYLEKVLEHINNGEPKSSFVGPKADDLAYVIYTSGSTGVPKGVMVEHRAVVNRLLWMQEKYPLTSNDILIQKTPTTFDVSVWEIFWWAFAGAGLYVLPPGLEKEPKALVRIIEEQKVSVIHFVPSMLNAFLLSLEGKEMSRRMSALRFVFASGEALKKQQVKLFAERCDTSRTHLINLYGPTEATVDVSYYNCVLENIPVNIPIGKPINNIRLYVLGLDNKPVPLGTSGELAIAGVGLARGYLDNIVLTESRFVSITLNGRKERVYKTGDLARWTQDGNLLFLGRIDNQVKLRGFRIELGEIENQVLRLESIKEVVVVLKGKSDDAMLVCYWVGEKDLDDFTIRQHLIQMLPEYMVPSCFVRLEKMPVTQNGKLNSAALPHPEINTASAILAANTPLEEKLVAVWADVMNISPDEVSTDKSLFEMGGNSIKAIHLINAISRVLSVDLEVKKIFEYPTVRDLSVYLNQADSYLPQNSINRAEDRLYYPASPAQERLYYLQMHNLESLAHNVSGAIEIPNGVSKDHLRSSIQSLVDRHETLRTSFILSDDNLLQRISNEFEFTLEEIDENSLKPEEAFKRFIRPFDLGSASLFRAALFKSNAKNKIFLFIDVHHIVCDGLSYDILVDDFRKLYHGVKLPSLNLRYVDYAVWQKNLDSRMEDQREFWGATLAEKLPFLSLPTLQDRSTVVIERASSKMCRIEGAAFEKLKRAARDSNVSHFMYLLSVYYLVMSELTGSKDIIIGTPAVGRTRTNLKNIVGTFVNILPLRMQLDSIDNHSQLLAKVKKLTTEAFRNQDLQFNEMVSLARRSEGDRLNPIVQVIFSYSDYSSSDQQLKDFGFVPVNLRGYTTTQYEFKIEALEQDDKIILDFVFSTDLYDSQFIEVVRNYFVDTLAHILEAIGSSSEVFATETLTH
ncbi:MAG: amino acid adenylation domain-containing protein [Chryseotalea sp. WA131a]|nr:MAG: amino acid adenylation domain-containing protein [Chryseotalea sp. WA131a]